MRPPNFPHDPEKALIADASVVINVTTSGRAHEIIGAIPNRFLVADVVVSELESGRDKGHKSAEQLQELIDSGLVEVAAMGDVAKNHFMDLVSGPAGSTLDDGEAATISIALEFDAIPLIDERKARRICGARYRGLVCGYAIDIFAHPAVGKALGKAGLASAVFNALQGARMHVWPEHEAWVVSVIGAENAAKCNNLTHAD